MRKKVKSILASLLALFLLVNTGVVYGQENYRETLNIAITAQPPLLDAHATVSNAAAGIAIHIFESLLTVDENYQPTPQLAESYEISEDALTYTFKLREGITFHNGEELTAEDAVASLNRWLTTSSKAKLLLEGAEFSQTGDYELVLTVKEATSDVLELLASPSQFAAITTKEIIDNVSEAGLDEYVGTGPYQFTEWRQDQFIQLDKFADYQSLEGPASGFTGTKGTGAQTLVFNFVTDHATRIIGIQTGEYDVAESVPLENYEEVANNQDLAVHMKQSGSLNLFLNTSDGALLDQNMRQAVLAALNNEDILQVSYSNPDLYELNPSFVNLALPQWSVDAGKEYYNQNNPEKAAELLAEANYNNQEIVLLTTPDYAEMYNATLVVQEQLRQAGFNPVVEAYDFATFLETKNDTSKWDLFITSNGYGLNPTQGSVVNPSWAGFDEPEVEAAITKIRTADTQEAATQAWAELQTYIYEFGAATVLGHYNSLSVTRATVEGFDAFHYPVYWNATMID